MMKQTLGNECHRAISLSAWKTFGMPNYWRDGFHALVVSTYIVIPTADDILLSINFLVKLPKWNKLIAAQLSTWSSDVVICRSRKCQRQRNSKLELRLFFS